jgi:HEAT repeat protein
MTIEELRRKLSVIEPSENMYAGLTDFDIPVLNQLLNDREEWMAARAVFALSRIGSPPAVAALATAAADARSEVRVAVAASVGQRPIALPDTAAVMLLRDQHPAVRKFAVHAVKPQNGMEPKTLLQHIASNDPAPTVRENALGALQKFRFP